MSTGFLVNDTCVFEVDVTECELVLTRFGSSSRFKTEYFSSLSTSSSSSMERFESCEFEAGDYKWKLALYTNGNEKEGNQSSNGMSLSLYLALADPDKFYSAMKVHVKFTLRLIDQVNTKHKEKTSQRTFSLKEKDWGFSKFLLLIGLYTASDCLVNDTCIFEVDITECELVNDQDS
ncbi:hypothetical protein AQUCO_00600335v1 [Aquilegia coerulea]|uniref:MATH domain-containing protein n=1 Tax=Aquilegia coerulea TaxID=218851 RepID=A0A2G5EP58_AQUCA|nr:hypothetical protein AQUCO_00600335v1 [Aquilegia coerulea]